MAVSRLERQLCDLIASGCDDASTACTQARLAILYARRGSFAQAREILDHIRSRRGLLGNPAVYSFVNLAEAIITAYSRGPNFAFDRLRRAKLLVESSSGAIQLSHLVNAWIASFSRALYRENDLEAALVAASLFDSFDHETAARYLLVLADSCQEIGDLDRAKRAYEASRVHAIELGDDLTISALMHNRASIHVFNLRIASALDQVVDLPRSLVAVEAQSAMSYANLVEDSAYAFAIDLSSAHVRILQGAWQEAADTLRRTLTDGVLEGWPSPLFVSKADLMLCDAKTGAIGSDAIAAAEALWRDYRDEIVPPGALVGIFSLNLCLRAHNLESKVLLDGMLWAINEYNLWRSKRIAMLDRVHALLQSKQ